MNVEHQIKDELTRLILEKWACSEKAGKDFIEFKINLEQFQSSNLRRVAYGISDRAKGLRVLDVGCGEGGFAVAAYQAGFDAYGVDICLGNIHICQLRASLNGIPKDRFLQVDPGGALPFSDGTFDIVTLFEVLEHVPMDELDRLIGEIRRVLVPTGFVYIEVPNALWPLEGHVDQHFVHWIPQVVRRPILRRFLDSKLMRRNNYLEGINYFSSRGWLRIISRNFSTVSSPDDLLLDFALGDAYQHGGFKNFKRMLKGVIRRIPRGAVVFLYRNFGPLSVFIARI